MCNKVEFQVLIFIPLLFRRSKPTKDVILSAHYSSTQFLYELVGKITLILAVYRNAANDVIVSRQIVLLKVSTG